MLARIDQVNADIAEVEAQVETHLALFPRAVARLDEIPGVGATAAHPIIAEIGTDMTRFPTPGTWRPGPASPPGHGIGREEEGHRGQRARQPVPGPSPG